MAESVQSQLEKNVLKLKKALNVAVTTQKSLVEELNVQRARAESSTAKLAASEAIRELWQNKTVEFVQFLQEHHVHAFAVAEHALRSILQSSPTALQLSEPELGSLLTNLQRVGLKDRVNGEGTVDQLRLKDVTAEQLGGRSATPSKSPGKAKEGASSPSKKSNVNEGGNKSPSRSTSPTTSAPAAAGTGGAPSPAVETTGGEPTPLAHRIDPYPTLVLNAKQCYAICSRYRKENNEPSRTRTPEASSGARGKRGSRVRLNSVSAHVMTNAEQLVRQASIFEHNTRFVNVKAARSDFKNAQKTQEGGGWATIDDGEQNGSSEDEFDAALRQQEEARKKLRFKPVATPSPTPGRDGGGPRKSVFRAMAQRRASRIPGAPTEGQGAEDGVGRRRKSVNMFASHGSEKQSATAGKPTALTASLLRSYGEKEVNDRSGQPFAGWQSSANAINNDEKGRRESSFSAATSSRRESQATAYGSPGSSMRGGVSWAPTTDPDPAGNKESEWSMRHNDEDDEDEEEAPPRQITPTSTRKRAGVVATHNMSLLRAGGGDGSLGQAKIVELATKVQLLQDQVFDLQVAVAAAEERERTMRAALNRVVLHRLAEQKRNPQTLGVAALLANNPKIAAVTEQPQQHDSQFYPSPPRAENPANLCLDSRRKVLVANAAIEEQPPAKSATLPMLPATAGSPSPRRSIVASPPGSSQRQRATGTVSNVKLQQSIRSRSPSKRPVFPPAYNREKTATPSNTMSGSFAPEPQASGEFNSILDDVPSGAGFKLALSLFCADVGNVLLRGEQTYAAVAAELHRVVAKMAGATSSLFSDLHNLYEEAARDRQAVRNIVDRLKNDQSGGVFSTEEIIEMLPATLRDGAIGQKGAEAAAAEAQAKATRLQEMQTSLSRISRDDAFGQLDDALALAEVAISTMSETRTDDDAPEDDERMVRSMNSPARPIVGRAAVTPTFISNPTVHRLIKADSISWSEELTLLRQCFDGVTAFADQPLVRTRLLVAEWRRAQLSMAATEDSQRHSLRRVLTANGWSAHPKPPDDDLVQL